MFLINLTHALCTVILVSILTCLIPPKWYKDCPISIRLMCVWLIMISFGILAISWLSYGLWWIFALILAGCRPI
jgi:hypothetical protein